MKAKLKAMWETVKDTMGKYATIFALYASIGSYVVGAVFFVMAIIDYLQGND